MPPELGYGTNVTVSVVELRPDGLWRWKLGSGGDQAVVWITKDWRAWEIDKMETTHIRNCLANILIDNIKGRGAYVPLLTAELEKRQQTETDDVQN